MKRDGATKSIWQDGVADYQPVNTWNKDTVYDVLIIGGGITGITTGLLLQEAGKKCIIAEAHTIGFGTTGGTTSHLNTLLDSTYADIESDFSKDDSKLVQQSAREAITMIESLAKKYNIDCDFEYKDGYLYAETDDEVKELEEIKEAADRAGVQTEWADKIPVPIPFKKAMKGAKQGQIHASKYLSGLAKAFEQQGGIILQSCIAGDITPGDNYSVETTLGSIKAKNLVFATHIPPGITWFSFNCAPYRSYAMAFTIKDGLYPDGLAYDMKDPYHYFRTHEVDGQKYIIGGGFDHKTGHEENTDHVFTELEAYLRQYYDIDTIAYKWSAQYYNSSDGLPYIGHMMGVDTTYVATGYGGNGIIFGTLSGQIICDMITGKKSPYQDLYSPSRIKPIAGFTEFVKENADVVSQFISKRFSYQKISELAELAPGEATLAKWEGQKVALYKDEAGKVHALDPVCPHAKCVVGWNSAEKSWDCPCHGGRYSCTGDLLTGPARKGLAQIKWEDIKGD